MISKETIESLRNNSKDLSVIIVEDDKVLADNYRDMACFIFDNVDVVYSGEEAYELFCEHPYDLVITDINMVGMNGVELIQKIKSNHPYQQFIVVSASNDSHHLLSLLKLKVSSFILKPFQLEEFLETVAEQIWIINQKKELENRSLSLEEKLSKIEQEKELQEGMLIQQSKLAQTGEMISMIAHQWRQPLSSITTQAAIFKTRMELGKLDDTVATIEDYEKDLYGCFDKIEKSAEYLSKTINDFRNFYRPSQFATRFNLHDSIETILDMLMLEQKGIKLIKEFNADPSFTYMGCEGEFQQVLMSLLNNARDVLLEKEVSEPMICIEVTLLEDDIVVSVKDNAGGVPTEIINNVFLPYFSTKSKKNGTGLGLYMARTIMLKHFNGNLTLENSDTFGGAVFSITLPMQENTND